jgi:hypothetical protein
MASKGKQVGEFSFKFIATINSPGPAGSVLIQVTLSPGGRNREEEWCGRRDSNPHERSSSTDFHTAYGFRRPDAAFWSARVRFVVWTLPSPSPGKSGA